MAGNEIQGTEKLPAGTIDYGNPRCEAGERLIGSTDRQPSLLSLGRNGRLHRRDQDGAISTMAGGGSI